MHGIQHWSEMKFWSSVEWSSAQEKLLKEEGKFNPKREFLWNALDLCPLDKVKVVLLGQDPYPNQFLAHGLAFSVPKGMKGFSLPPSLRNILKEYEDDLYLPQPSSGDLTKWAEEGVLLWNTIPTCPTGKSMGHADWPEWRKLTLEVLQLCVDKATTFVAMGNVAQKLAESVVEDDSDIIRTAHPSPLAAGARRNPFIGSRIFSRVNAKLCEQGDSPIDWKLE